MIKALGFLAKQAEVKVLQEALETRVVQAFNAGQHMSKRKEASPLPWHIVVDMERELLSPATPLWLKLLLGFWLVRTWGSLRCSDALRCYPRNLVHKDEVLMGECVAGQVHKARAPMGHVDPWFHYQPPEQRLG